MPNRDQEIWRRIYQRAEEVVDRNIADETILVPIRGKLADMQRIFSLNPVADYVWQQLDGEKTLQEICEDVLTDFDVAREEAEADIQGFVAELLKEGLIELNIEY